MKKNLIKVVYYVYYIIQALCYAKTDNTDRCKSFFVVFVVHVVQTFCIFRRNFVHFGEISPNNKIFYCLLFLVISSHLTRARPLSWFSVYYVYYKYYKKSDVFFSRFAFTNAKRSLFIKKLFT